MLLITRSNKMGFLLLWKVIGFIFDDFVVFKYQSVDGFGIKYRLIESFKGVAFNGNA